MGAMNARMKELTLQGFAATVDKFQLRVSGFVHGPNLPYRLVSATRNTVTVSWNGASLWIQPTSR